MQIYCLMVLVATNVVTCCFWLQDIVKHKKKVKELQVENENLISSSYDQQRKSIMYLDKITAVCIKHTTVVFGTLQMVEHLSYLLDQKNEQK